MKSRTETKVKRIVESFKQHNPKTCLEAEKLCNIELTPVAEQGAYRDTYFVKGAPLVVKFPKNTAGTASHSRAEIKAVRRILRGKRKYRLLHSYMPEIFYGNVKTGVILMRRYKPLRSKYDVQIADTLERLVQVLWPEKVWTTDVHGANIALDDDDEFKIIDLGYFTKEGHEYESAES